MRRQILSFSVLAACCLSLSPAWGQSDSLTTAGPWHPEGDSAPVAVLTGLDAMPSGAVVGGDPLRGTANCEQIGGYMSVFTNPTRYRGAVYRIESPAQLDEFSVELAFSGTANLYFSIHRRPENTSEQFVKVWPEMGNPQFVVRAGVGRAFYSTGTIDDLIGEDDGFRLEAGFEYAIGVAWGNVAVSYGYDGPTYPRPFSKGQVLGGAALSGLTPPLNNITLNPPPGAGIFTGGAYSTRLCFLPDPGACCIDGGNECMFLTEDDCNGQNGEWTGPQVTCEDAGFCTNFPEGVCCTAGGQCTDFNVFYCDYVGGTFKSGEACQDEPCTPRGACCVGNGCVPNLTEAECEGAPNNGTYRGDDTICDEVTPCNAGACCFGPECFQLSGAQCAEFNGEYRGNLTVCGDDPCEVTGACCNGSACEVISEADCAAQGGNYRGDSTDCDSEVPACGLGACCTQFGCLDVSQSLCAGALAGTWRGEGTSCDSITPHCPGTCCWNGANNCNGAGGARLSPEDCQQLPQSVFLGYDIGCTTPQPSPNPPINNCVGTAPNGACCMPGGTCAVVDDQPLCESELGGIWQGEGSNCAQGCPSCVNLFDCDDDNACTNDSCNMGTCVHTPRNIDDNNACTLDSCISGFVVHAPRNCSDGVACTVDTCNPMAEPEANACIHTVNDAACSDGNDCTDDTCSATLGCQRTNNTAACSDNSECTVGDVCDGGACVPGPAPECDDSVECTIDSCDPLIGCVYQPDAATCDDGNPCTDDICDPISGCLYDHNTAACDDENPCTTNDACAAGACVGGPALDCNDNVECTVDACDAQTPGDPCIHTANDGACDDGNPCTQQACDVLLGCQTVGFNEGATCDDGDACTDGDTCTGADCTGGPALDCDDGLACTDDSCDALTGCANESTCDDQDPCTTDACTAGGCVATPLDCDDEDPCTADSCDAGVCVHDALPCGGACCLSGECTIAVDAAACEATGYVCDVTALNGATCFGDADGNGTVNAGDRGFVAANIGLSGPELICQFDIDGNGFINAGDRGFVAANIGLCAPLPNYQNGSGLNASGAGPDGRYAHGVYEGDGTICDPGACE